jgi:crotonobetainyl-CoA:carnitine CoA-transferase CaiB-like acyl-CoA transferase
VTTGSKSPLPLDGIRVIDFTQVYMGPCATQMLADYGADVIKIERPGAGDLSRTALPDKAGLLGPVFCSLNRNKRSLVLDLRKNEERAVVLKLIETADVVVNNFRAGVMERMGLGYADLAKINPRIIYAIGTGYGQEGPYAHKGGQDVLAQAMSGVMARKCNDDEPLTVNATTFADYTCGMHMMQGILLAILQRQKTGKGQQIAVSLLDSMLAAQMQEATAHLMRGKEINWGAMPLSGVFKTRDGALVLVGAFKADPVGDIGKALELPGLGTDPRFATHELRVENKVALQAIFRERFASNTTKHWLARLDEQDLLCAPVMTLGEMLADEQTAINGMILEGTGEIEPLRVMGSPIHMSDAPVSIRLPPPSLGRHTEAIKAELGLAAKKAGA